MGGSDDVHGAWATGIPAIRHHRRILRSLSHGNGAPRSTRPCPSRGRANQRLIEEHDEEPACREMVAAVLIAALAVPASVFGQDTLWNTWRQGGLQALHEGRMADAERLLTAALEQAEKYGLEDLRVADAANDLAVVYANSGKPLEAELLFSRAWPLVKRSSGPTIRRRRHRPKPRHPLCHAEALSRGGAAAQTFISDQSQGIGGKHARTALPSKRLSSSDAIQGHREKPNG